MSYSCDLCGKEFRTIDHRRFCTVGCEVRWWSGNEALEENEKLRAALSALKVECEQYDLMSREIAEVLEGSNGAPTTTLARVVRTILRQSKDEARASALGEVAEMFDLEAEQGPEDMTFKEFCEWIAARIRAMSATPSTGDRTNE